VTTEPPVRYDATIGFGVPCASSCSGLIDVLRDGRCQDQNNNCACNWDDGDCCEPSGDEAQFLYCRKVGDGTCCLDPSISIITTEGTTTSATTGTTNSVTVDDSGDGNDSSSGGSFTKYSDASANSCTSKFSCFGSSCDKVISKMLIKSGTAFTYEILESSYDCDCRNCGSSNVDDFIVAIAGMD
jgi:hypothetical protein